MSDCDGIAAPGDFVILAPGSYPAGPHPVNSGASIASRIRYWGNAATVELVQLPSFTFTRSYITVTNVTTGSVNFTETAGFDSLYAVTVNGGISLGGSNDNFLGSITMPAGLNRKIVQDDGNCPGPTDCQSGPLQQQVAERDTLRKFIADLGVGLSYYNAFYLRRARNLVVDSSRFTLRADDTGNNVIREFFFAKNCAFKDNYWYLVNQGTRENMRGIQARDSTTLCTYTRDTVITTAATGSPPLVNHLESPGNFAGSCKTNTWTSCILVNLAPYGGYGFEGALQQDTYQNTVMAAKNASALYFMTGSAGGASVIDNCTFYGSGVGGVVHYENDGTQSSAARPWWWRGTLTFTDNTIYSTSTETGPASGGRSAVYWWAPPASDTLTSNYNYYCSYAYSLAPGDRSVSYRDAAGSEGTISISRPTEGWSTLTGQDVNSTYVGPIGRPGPNFVDSLFAADNWIDVHLQLGSGAIGVAQAGGDAGAFSFSSDTAPPDTVGDLLWTAATSTSVSLSWTNVGDDDRAGAATSYEVRYSTAPITAGNFVSATLGCSCAATGAVGTAGSTTITNLATNRTYYFALKAVDDAGNKSVISNTVWAQTNAQTGDSDKPPPRNRE